MTIPLPSALTRGTVTWTVGHVDTTGPLDGANGVVRFKATAIAVAYSDRTVLPAIVETPVTDGVMKPVALVVNDPDVWNWEVTIRLGVLWAPFHINVSGAGVDLASASITPGKGPVRVLKGDQGVQGASLTVLEQVAEDTLRGEIVDPLTGETRVHEYKLPRGPEGPYGGTSVTDPQVASYLADETTETGALLRQDYVSRRTIMHDVRDYGAKGDNTTDDSAAFQAAIDAARKSGGRAYAWGTFRTDQTVTINSHADFANATVNYHGIGIGFIVTGWRLDVSMPSVFNGRKSNGGGWDSVAGSIGVRMLNCNGCTVHVKFVQNFEIGLSVHGVNTGCAYNNVFLGWLFNNKRNQVLSTESTTGVGYSNQNTFIGGRFSHHAAEGTNVPGVESLSLTTEGDGGPNSNLWLNSCLEGAQAQYAFNIETGKNNMLVNVRLEYGNAYRFGPNAKDNMVTVGFYGSQLRAVREDSAGFGNNVHYHRFEYTYDRQIEYWQAGRAHPWLAIDSGTRTLALGNSDQPPVAFRGGTGYVSLDGVFRPHQNNTYDLGTASNRWRNIIAAGYISTPTSVDFELGTAPYAAPGRARVFARTLPSGKMQLIVRWPNNTTSELATEP